MRIIIAFSFIALALAAILTPSPAKAATVAISGLQDEPEVMQVTIGHNYSDNPLGIFCQGGTFYFSYEQLMTIPGVGRVVANTDTINDAGVKSAVLLARCENGINLYELYQK